MLDATMTISVRYALIWLGWQPKPLGGILLSTAAKGDRGKQWTQCIENPGKTFEYWHKLETE